MQLLILLVLLAAPAQAFELPLPPQDPDCRTDWEPGGRELQVLIGLAKALHSPRAADAVRELEEFGTPGASVLAGWLTDPDTQRPVGAAQRARLFLLECAPGAAVQPAAPLFQEPLPARGALLGALDRARRRGARFDRDELRALTLDLRNPHERQLLARALITPASPQKPSPATLAAVERILDAAMLGLEDDYEDTWERVAHSVRRAFSEDAEAAEPWCGVAIRLVGTQSPSVNTGERVARAMGESAPACADVVLDLLLARGELAPIDAFMDAVRNRIQRRACQRSDFLLGQRLATHDDRRVRGFGHRLQARCSHLEPGDGW